jgi:dual specificity tyrosine-phosphorylation-regulated kinase 2/3/4
MHDQGKIEVSLVQKLNEAPGFATAHIVHGLDFFVFRNHICATFEILGPNLFEYSRSIRFRPLDSAQMRPIAKAMLTGLAFLHKNMVIHCDMKPENVLLMPNSSTDVRLIDFGSSCLIGHQRYEYIQSRFYRAPEVILGLSYGPPMDIWSFGCIVAEMMMGRPLFPGGDESEQMQMLMEVLGLPPRGMLDRCTRRKHFFGPDGRPFISTKGRRRRTVGSSSLRIISHITDNLLLDLLGKCLEWDQTRRITAHDAVSHPWFSIREMASARSSYHGPPLSWRGF